MRADYNNIEHQHAPTAERRLHGKVAVITGASTGIGEWTTWS